MISTLIIEGESKARESLKMKIDQCCPFFEVIGVAQTFEEANHLLNNKDPDLVFINPVSPFVDLIDNVNRSARSSTEFIFVSNTINYTTNAIQLNPVGFLSRPLQDKALMTIVAKFKQRFLIKEEGKKNKLLLEKLLHERRANELIGIPTMEGYEFIPVKNIIRCEGLQKCTRVVTTTQTDIVSSYNIGVFIKLLEPYHFFSPHKSHLINLAYVRRYLREGTIVLRDKSCVPVSKRKKCEFLKQVVHL